MKIGLIGAGLIGTKRAKALLSSPDQLIAVTDPNTENAYKIINNHPNCKLFSSWEGLVNSSTIDAIIISTPHNLLAKITLQALKNNKHVLCEKPLGVSVEEIKKCIKVAERRNLIYKAGYNHRFHPAVLKAYKLFKDKKIGELMFIKGVYGHGGRKGYEKEWRTSKIISGGGELIDQGSHLVDLYHWFDPGKLVSATGLLKSLFWNITVEDNAFFTLQTKQSIGQFHTSWTEWKNIFNFEIHGATGYLKINGLGGSYGDEILIYGRRNEGKAPTEKNWSFNSVDKSWELEWENFRNAILKKQQPLSSGKDGLWVFECINSLYKSTITLN